MTEDQARAVVEARRVPDLESRIDELTRKIDGYEESMIVTDEKGVEREAELLAAQERIGKLESALTDAAEELERLQHVVGEEDYELIDAYIGSMRNLLKGENDG